MSCLDIDCYAPAPVNCPRLSVCPSRRPSVSGVSRHNCRTERPRKPKFGRMEAHHTRNQWAYLEKVKVTRPSNAHAVNAQYLPNRKAYELQTWSQTEHEDPHQRQAPWPSRSKVKVARSRDASDRCWPISRERNVLGRPKLVERLHTPRAIMRSSFKAKDGVRRPTNLRIGTPVEHALSTVTPSYKAVLGSCTRAGTYRVGRTRRPRSLFPFRYNGLYE